MGWLQKTVSDIFGLDRKGALATTALFALTTGFAIFWFFHSAPPMQVAIASGPEGSSFYKSAEKYADILARSRIKTRVLASEGSLNNLKLLTDSAGSADAGFVQGGVADAYQLKNLVSLGSVNHLPLLIFYRSARPIRLLSELSGKRLAAGPEGSGTRTLALALLADNGIKPEGKTLLSAAEPEQATKDLLTGKLDAVFLMGDSAPGDVIKELLRDRAVRLYSFAQADAYVRRFTYLNKMTLPEGAVDFGSDIPSSDVVLVGPTVELIARPGLDPALTDLLLDAAREVNGGPSLFKQQGEFPAPQQHEFKLSVPALRFYSAGKSFFYRLLPFWAASLVDRILVSFVPLLVILIPGFKAVPAALRWRINLVVYRWYRRLLKLEKELAVDLSPEKRAACLRSLAEIEGEVNRMKVPAPYATQFYELRGHINFVRSQLASAVPAAQPR
jgi:TRAP-type uncharacterized transport system substrate-binding protein